LNLLLLYENKTALLTEQLKVFICNTNNGIIRINEKAINGDSPLLSTIKRDYYNFNNTKTVKLLMDYTKENSIILDINEKHTVGNFPLMIIIRK